VDVMPVLIAIPHGGDRIPEELQGRTSLTERDIFEDSDSLTRQLFGLKNEVTALLDTDIASVFIDLDRSPDDCPPQHTDGIIKFETARRQKVYRQGQAPDSDLIEILLAKYYHPWHRKLAALKQMPTVRIALDCHSMLPYSPASSTSPGRQRPLICLSNGGDPLGRPLGRTETVTCPHDTLQLLAECFRESFELEKDDVRLNVPFKGGHIIHSHHDGRIPWVQLAINKKLYLPMANRKRTAGEYSIAKIEQIRENVRRTLQLFFLNY
jgi:N-formylglutamate deformylase